MASTSCQAMWSAARGARGEGPKEVPIDRQELLDRLEAPQEADANLGLDARRFLGFNPRDEEVRALGRLSRERLYP